MQSLQVLLRVSCQTENKCELSLVWKTQNGDEEHSLIHLSTATLQAQQPFLHGKTGINGIVLRGYRY